MHARIKIVGIVFAVASLALIGKLFFWQVLQADSLASQAHAQHSSGETLLARRGSILAADGTWLAKSDDAWLVYAQIPDLTDSAQVIADKLAPLLVDFPDDMQSGDAHALLLAEASRIKGLLANKNAYWVPLKHRLSNDTKKNIEALGIPGLGFDKEEERVYPEASEAAHVLGFVGKDNAGNDQGYFGLEGYYNLSLSGKAGYVRGESDAVGTPLLFGTTKEVSATPGVDLKTHIDKTIQLLFWK